MKNKVEIFKDKAGDQRIRVTAAENGKILYSSTEGYKNKKDMVKSALRSSHAIILEFDPTPINKVAQKIQELKDNPKFKELLDKNINQEQLVLASQILVRPHNNRQFFMAPPFWDKDLWGEMVRASKEERLVIASAFNLLELERISLSQNDLNKDG